ncbi:hypothetical protein LCGC14_0469650 [marine sediment metagenome]|uniref:HIT domain-containing protein n=1 Tax=marine sediment metagenome TaxID=412755 RepID=A0A0F9SCM6_9ZZZZ
MEDYKCECGFELWNPIVSHKDSLLSCSYLSLYDDARFLGRCILSYNEHEEDFADMDLFDMTAFMSDVQQAGRAIQKATGAERINYAILGNAVPHVHVHIIPRYGTDPYPKKSPWNHPGKVMSLEEALKYKIIEDIQMQLKE